MSPRAVPEWIGKTPDSKPPNSVRLRILRAYDSTCYLTGLKITGSFEIEHIVALSLGGENREKNMAPALPAGHKVKSAAEAKIRAKADSVAKKAHGIKNERSRKIQSPGFPSAKPKREPKARLEPKVLFL